MSEAVKALEAALAEVRKSERHAQERYDRWAKPNGDVDLRNHWLGKLSGLARARQILQVEIANVLYAESVV